MIRCWAPNGYDVVNWPRGDGLTAVTWVDDDKVVAEDAKARRLEGLRKGRAASIASRRARAAQRANRSGS